MGPNLTRPASYRRIKAPCERDLEFWSGVAMFGRLFFSLCISFIDTQHLGEWFRTNLSHSFSLGKSKIPNNGVPVSKMGSSDLPCGSPNIKCFFFLSSTPKNPLFGSSKLFFVWYQVNQSVGSYMGWTTSIAMRWWLEKWCPKIETCHTDFLLVKMTRCIWDRLYALFVPITDLKKWTQINQPGDS